MGCSLHCHLCCHSLQRPPLRPTMKTCQSRHHYTELYLCHCRHSDSTSTTQSTHVADNSQCFTALSVTFHLAWKLPPLALWCLFSHVMPTVWGPRRTPNTTQVSTPGMSRSGRALARQWCQRLQGGCTALHPATYWDRIDAERTCVHVGMMWNVMGAPDHMQQVSYSHSICAWFACNEQATGWSLKFAVTKNQLFHWNWNWVNTGLCIVTVITKRKTCDVIKN